MSNRTKIRRRESAVLNNRTYIDIYDRLFELAVNRFKWSNLPETCDERFLENSLFKKGFCLFFKDEVIGYLTLRATLGGQLDVYNIPIDRRAYANNGYQNNLTNKDSVIIMNNSRYLPDIMTIENFALQLYEIKRAYYINIKRQKTPQIILTSMQQRLTFENLIEQYDGNVPFILGDKSFQKELDDVINIDTSTHFIADKLSVQFHTVWNEALTYLGIDNSNTDKKERLVENEVAGNNGAVEMQRNIALTARKRACEKINRMFGLEIDVEFRSNIKLIDSEKLTDFEKLSESEGDRK